MTSLDSGLHALAGHSALLDGAARFAAGTLPYIIVLIVVCALWRSHAALRAAAAACLGALAALGVGAVIATAWDRPRPFVTEHFTPLVAHALDASFPSDHLLALGALSMGAWLAWRLVGVVAGSLSALVAVARAVTGVHYLSDVIVGFALGAALTLAAWHAIRPVARHIEMVDRALARLPLRPRGSQL